MIYTMNVTGHNAPVELSRLISVMAGFNSQVSYCARMVEQVDTVDLKSAAYKACGFKSLYEQHGETNEI